MLNHELTNKYHASFHVCQTLAKDFTKHRIPKEENNTLSQSRMESLQLPRFISLEASIEDHIVLRGTIARRLLPPQ